MTMRDVVGTWELKAIRVQDSGKWIEEIVYGGHIVFTSSSIVVLFIRTSEGPYGYSGHYTIEGETLQIRPYAGMSETMESMDILRKIEKVDAKTLKITGDEAATDRFFETHFERIG